MPIPVRVKASLKIKSGTINIYEKVVYLKSEGHEETVVRFTVTRDSRIEDGSINHLPVKMAPELKYERDSM